MLRQRSRLPEGSRLASRPSVHPAPPSPWPGTSGDVASGSFRTFPHARSANTCDRRGEAGASPLSPHGVRHSWHRRLPLWPALGTAAGAEAEGLAGPERQGPGPTAWAGAVSGPAPPGRAVTVGCHQLSPPPSAAGRCEGRLDQPPRVGTCWLQPRGERV